MECKILPCALLEPGDPLGGLPWPAVAGKLSFLVKKRRQRQKEALLLQSGFSLWLLLKPVGVEWE